MVRKADLPSKTCARPAACRSRGAGSGPRGWEQAELVLEDRCRAGKGAGPAA